MITAYTLNHAYWLKLIYINIFNNINNSFCFGIVVFDIYSLLLGIWFIKKIQYHVSR